MDFNFAGLRRIRRRTRASCAKSTFGALLVLPYLVSCHNATTAGEAEHERAASSAQATLLPFKQRLMAALQDGIAQGPAAAIDVCRLEAPRIADSISSETVRVGRTSHRLRNPDNAPRAWMRPILEEFRNAPADELLHRTVEVGDGWIGYAEPIYMKPLCLTCHGTDLAPSVANQLREAYPEDRATGFAVGEFRGLFWVEQKTSEGTGDRPDRTM